MWFVLEDANAIGVMDGSRVRTMCADNLRTPIRVVPDGDGAWVMAITGDVGFVVTGKVVRFWPKGEALSAAADLVVDGNGHAFAPVSGESKLARFDRRTGETTFLELGHMNMGGIARDRLGRVWVPVWMRKTPRALRMGLVRVDRRGMRTYDLPFVGSPNITVDRRGRLWFPGQAFVVLTPPPDA